MEHAECIKVIEQCFPWPTRTVLSPATNIPTQHNSNCNRFATPARPGFRTAAFGKAMEMDGVGGASGEEWGGGGGGEERGESVGPEGRGGRGWGERGRKSGRLGLNVENNISTRRN